VVRSLHFMHGKEELAPGITDISWFDQHGNPIAVEAWQNPEERVIVLRHAARHETVQALTLLLNPTDGALDFRLPPPHVPQRLLIDTDKPDAPERDVTEDHIQVAARSAVLVVGVHQVDRP
jgi:glycogen operon protein